MFWTWRYNLRIRRSLEAGLDRQAEHNRLETRYELVDEQLRITRETLEERTRDLADRQASQAALEARLDESRKALIEKEAQFRQSSEAVKQEFELLANRVFERQGVKHSEKLASVLSPFKEQIVEFRKRVEEVYHAETKDRATLLNEVRTLQRASERINTEAGNLTRALKGDVKVQGNWGEMVLERVLEESGLRANHEYFVQEARRSEDGDLKRPDVLIRLPDDKDVVVDAKLSLVAYEEAVASESDEGRAQAVRRHLASMRAHVKRLSEQDYDQLDDLRSLDFVLLFVPIESAFTLAMEQDHKLFTEAFERRIVIVSPTTQMMTLRIIHNVWRYEKQS
ncbi:MAG: DNA recombination protein RmuC, partial [Pseudomonadales bacterium]